MLKAILIVGSGSFIGGALRCLVSTVMKGVGGGSFPWGTLAVNLAGCLLIGLLYGLFSKFSTTGSSWCLFLTTGLCGGFTTFSTFANESLKMLQSGNIWGFAGYVGVSVLAGIALTALGYLIAR